MPQMDSKVLHQPSAWRRLTYYVRNTQTASDKTAPVRRWPNLFIALVSVFILFACSLSINAQTRPNPIPSPDPNSNEKRSQASDDLPNLGPMEEEMRAKRAIKLAEKEYQDNLERAREVAEIGAQLRDAHKQNKPLGREANKKLDRLEKLAKRIRTEAGGSTESTTVDDPPRELEATLVRIAELSEVLRRTVEKTPRQVVSASVIEQANVILELVKIARSFVH